MTDTLMPLIKQFLPYAQKKMGFEDPPTLFLRSDAQNAVNPLGKTAFYDPAAKSITLYITNRHPKDVMRSFSHELVHHTQNCNGKFDNVNGSEMGEGYAQNDDHLREMEREAYEMGNLCFRDWEDSIKNTIYFEHLQKGAKKMSLKDWRNKELTSLLSEAWGFKFNTLQEFDEFNGTGEVQEEGVEEEAEEEEVQEASNPRAGNEDRQRPGRNPADRMHEAEEEEDDDEEEDPDEPDELDMLGMQFDADEDQMAWAREMSEAQEEEEEEEEEQARHGRVDKPRGKGFKPRGKGLSEAQLSALVREAIKKALTTLQKG